jgi:hypothetical protein
MAETLNRGLNNINILNAYLNFPVNDQFEIRFGRFFTPYIKSRCVRSRERQRDTKSRLPEVGIPICS